MKKARLKINYNIVLIFRSWMKESIIIKKMRTIRRCNLEPVFFFSTPDFRQYDIKTEKIILWVFFFPLS